MTDDTDFGIVLWTTDIPALCDFLVDVAGMDVEQRMPGFASLRVNGGTVFLHADWSFLVPVRPGDVITAEVEVLEMREDKPISILRTTITNQDGTIVLDGTAVVYQVPLTAA